MAELQGLLAQKVALDEVNALLYGLIGPDDTGAVLTVVGATSNTNQYDISVLNPAGRYEGPDGRCNDAEPPPGLYDAVRRLRAAMFRDGSGTWFSAVFRLTAEGSATAEFDYENEPGWDAAPAPEVYVADLEHFPRDEAHLPPWLKAQIARADG